MKKQFNSYLGFSKKELNGILVLCAFIILILTFPLCYRYFEKPEVYDLKSFKREVALFKASAEQVKSPYAASGVKRKEPVLSATYFDFDPNSLSVAGWSKLGLSVKQINVINNYRAKGGKFFKPADLKKIYSISETQYHKLEPYIKITAQNETQDGPRKIAFIKDDKRAKNAFVELNSADSSALESIRGIGAVYALRIIRFRNRLGGFYDKTQLKEVYGIDSVKYAELEEQVTIDTSFIKQVKLNTATFDDLKAHPYLTFKQVNAIIQYRKQHGNYSSIEDLRKVRILNDKIIRKIEPYLSFDP